MTQRVAVVTDSTSDIDPERAAALGIHVVPLFVNFGDTRYRDTIDLSRADFYDRLKHGKVLPTTSQPTAKMFEETFAPLVEEGRPIVGVFIAQQLSGTINAARAAADQYPGAQIELVDSLTASAGLGMQAMEAARLARDGADVRTIVAALSSDIRRQRGFAALPDLSHVVRTGRIGKAQGAIGTVLRIVPVLRLGRGEVEEESRVRTYSRAQESMIDATIRDLGDVPRSRIIVIHANVPEEGEALRARVAARLAETPALFELIEAGPAIAVHSGPGATGIFSISG